MEVKENANVDRHNRLRCHKLSLTCVCIDSKDQHIFTGSKDGSIIKWCLKSTKILNKVNPISKHDAESNKDLAEKRHHKHINSIAISSDDKLLATGGWDKQIRIWSPDSLTWLHTFTKHRQEVTALTFRKGIPTLYSGSADRSVMLWTLEEDDNRCFIEALYGHESTIASIDTLRRERILTAGGRDQSLIIWKIVEQAQTAFQTKHESVDIARYIDDKTFVSGGEDGTISVWTTMRRSPVCCVPKAHGYNKSKNKVETDGRTRLCFWITALATFLLKEEKQIKKTVAADENDDDIQGKDMDIDGDEDDEDKDKESGDEDDEMASDNEPEVQQENGVQDDGENVIALVASGSCDAELRIWKLTKNLGKFELKHHQSLECPGFINDLRFTSNGDKIIAACGQEHRFGRWWRLKTARNCMRVFDVDKI